MKLSQPLVSIVIPAYNQLEIFLRPAIESAINQTYRNIEIIISDNHSTNGMTEIIFEYAKADKRIKIIKPPKFLPLIENFIFAYSHASGEYICPLSSDDILYPEIVAEHLKPFDTYPDLCFSYSSPLFFTTDIEKAKWKPGNLNTGFYTSAVFLENYIKYRTCSWGGILFKTGNYNNVGGFKKDYTYAGDVDTIIDLILLNKGVYCINKPLSAIRQWAREEHANRTPFALNEVAKIYDGVLAKVNKNKLNLNPGIIKKAKKDVFIKEIYPIAYFIQFNKRNKDIIEKTAVVIQDNYPKGIFNFIVANRKNKIGLAFSVIYLSYMKVKVLFGGK